MTIPEYRKLHGFTYKQVYDRIQNGDIPARKEKGQWNIVDKAQDRAAMVKADGTPDGRMTTGGRLKDVLTAVQIRKIQQQLDDGKRAIISEWLDGKAGETGFRERFFCALEPLAGAFRDARLSPEQAEMISAGFEKSKALLRQLT